MLKTLFFAYQRAMYYAAQTKSEYGKIGSFIPETISIITLLAVRDIKIPFWQIPLFYIAVMLLATLIGRLLVWIGVVDYNNRLAFKYNPPVVETLERLKRIEEKLNGLDKPQK